MQPGKPWLVYAFKRGIRKREITLASCFLFISKVIPRTLRTHVTELLPYQLKAGVGGCWTMAMGGRGWERRRWWWAKSTLQILAVWGAGAVAQADAQKRTSHVTGVLCFWTHLEPKRNCLLLVSIGMETGKWGLCLIFVKTQNTLQPYAALSLLLKK